MLNVPPIRLCRTPALVSILVLLTFTSACSKRDYSRELPDSSEIGTSNGRRWTRVITHFHSQYSYDACDKKSLSDGEISTCRAELRDAMCRNRVDLLFLTDHPDRMSTHSFSELLLFEGSDVLSPNSTTPTSNTIVGCANGFRPQMVVGFEGQLLALAMDSHLSDPQDQLAGIYSGEDLALRNRLNTDVNALVAVPHLESRDMATVKSLSPDAVEIYNIHANLDPKLRKKWLGLRPFEHVARVLSYLADPYGDLYPDFSFLDWLEVASVYNSRWSWLVAGGVHATGIGGSDSHENIFPQKGSDGERLDAHRRLSRMMSNHVLVSSVSVANIKAAIKAGRSALVFEGFGTPTGFDFGATQGATVFAMGDTIALGSGAISSNISLPGLHSQSPGMDDVDDDDRPHIRTELHWVDTAGTDTVVATARGASLTYTITQQGAYRAELYITPRHLKDFARDENSVDREYRWIVSNHIYVTP